RALREAARVLAPGGRLVVCAWLAADEPRGWARRHLLEPIVREGRLAWLPTAVELTETVRAAGFGSTRIEDLTRRVRRTWTICLRRLAAALLSRRDYRRFLFDGGAGERVFAVTMVRIWLAYRLGAMRYGMLTARLPDRGEPGAADEARNDGREHD
ncbi:MAG: SAM-dependent methyltransferase, partial [Acidobacteriota bacterium]